MLNHTEGVAGSHAVFLSGTNYLFSKARRKGFSLVVVIDIFIRCSTQLGHLNVLAD
jgi:hypothetical protein